MTASPELLFSVLWYHRLDETVDPQKKYVISYDPGTDTGLSSSFLVCFCLHIPVIHTAICRFFL